MTDQPEWREWADREHRSLMKKRGQPTNPKNPRLECAAPGCKHKTTRNQARKNGGVCQHCKAPLNDREK